MQTKAQHTIENTMLPSSEGQDKTNKQKLKLRGPRG